MQSDAAGQQLPTALEGVVPPDVLHGARRDVVRQQLRQRRVAQVVVHVQRAGACGQQTRRGASCVDARHAIEPSVTAAQRPRTRACSPFLPAN